MKEDFWLERWQQGRIGFHQPEGSPLLRQYWSELALAPNAPILVPLCGKSQDMVWLAERGHPVTGIEFSEIAAQEFFTENGLKYRRKQAGAFDCFSGHDIEIRVGDFFDLPAETLAGFSGFYDRGALIALPEAMRASYAAHLLGGLQRGATGLLITLEYDPTQMEGPPFSLDDAAVGQLYGRYAHVDLLAEQQDKPGDNLRKRGLTSLRERIYRIVRC